jgi:hypothetical protein
MEGLLIGLSALILIATVVGLIGFFAAEIFTLAALFDALAEGLIAVLGESIAGVFPAMGVPPLEGILTGLMKLMECADSGR